MKLNFSKWTPFFVSDIFLLYNGKGITKEEIEDRACFIQKEPFYTAQNVAILQEKIPLSNHTKLFISTLIRNECKIKYQAFGRELNAHFRKDFTIKLPIQHDANGIIYDETYEFSDEGYIPDWDWMDSYMRSLPYGDRI